MTITRWKALGICLSFAGAGAALAAVVAGTATTTINTGLLALGIAVVTGLWADSRQARQLAHDQTSRTSELAAETARHNATLAQERRIREHDHLRDLIDRASERLADTNNVINSLYALVSSDSPRRDILSTYERSRDALREAEMLGRRLDTRLAADDPVRMHYRDAVDGLSAECDAYVDFDRLGDAPPWEFDREAGEAASTAAQHAWADFVVAAHRVIAIAD